MESNTQPDYILWYVYKGSSKTGTRYLTKTVSRGKLLQKSMNNLNASIEEDELWIDYDTRCFQCSEEENGVLMSGNWSGMCLLCSNMVSGKIHEYLQFTQPTPLPTRTVYLPENSKENSK